VSAVDCLVALDAGTGSGRCVVYDTTGQPLASAQEPFRYRIFEDPTIPFVRGFDLDPEAFWGVIARCARKALGALPADARIRGVIATSQREGCVFLDRDGEVLYAGPNLDARAVAEGMELEGQIGAARLHAITGHAPPYIFPIARYQWFRKRHDASAVAHLLMLNDWITWLLSGVAVGEHSNAGESMLYDVSRREWSAELLERLEIPRAILPELVEPGTRVGSVTARAAAATGIPEGTPVFAGGADTESALLGSAVYRPGETGAVLGTTSPVQMVTDRPVIDPTANLWTSCHVVPGRWVLESNAGDTGDAYRWLLELIFGGTDPSAHAAAEEMLRTFEPGPRQVFCHLGPVIFNIRDMNPFKPAGLLFRFPILHVDRPARAELLHGFFQSVAFAIRGNCEQLTATSGVEIPLLTVSGGMAQSPALARVLADTLGIPLAISTVSETASLGCAILAAVGAGLHPDVPSAVSAMTRRLQFDPEAAQTAEYDERYRKWREVYGLLATWML
jgi:autoinducer 2 (AI-2) kinase